MLYRVTKDIIRDKEKNTLQIVARLVRVYTFVCLQSPCVGNPLMGVFVFVAVCAERREVMANCVPYPLHPLFSLTPSLSHPNQIFNGLHWCHHGISVAKALKGLKSVAC